MTRGVYHTVGNNFFLNKRYVGRPGTLMSVMRHEGWHAAQDCMAGSIKNNMIAIIHNEEDVPEMWQEMARRTYRNMPHAIPWEKEAFWAGHTENMTLEAIKSWLLERCGKSILLHQRRGNGWSKMDSFLNNNIQYKLKHKSKAG